MKAWYAIIICVVLSLSAKSQTFSGQVVDITTSKPLKATTVMFLGDSGRAMLSFTRTKENGSFIIVTPEGKTAYFIMFSRLGYAKDTIPTSRFVKGQTIWLHQQAVKIKEIKIKAPQITQKGDTLSYLVSSFRQKQDRSIADVIAKMPGLQVNKDGTIEYQGRKINKFYIEGMDLLGSKYSQASENADIDVGSKMQGGFKPVSDDRLIGMMFARKMQSISMYKYNNSEKDIIKEVDANSLFDDGAPVEAGLLSNIHIDEPSRTTHNVQRQSYVRSPITSIFILCHGHGKSAGKTRSTTVMKRMCHAAFSPI